MASQIYSNRLTMMDNPSCMCAASRNVTPFLLSVQHALLLDKSEEFQILRTHLRQTAPSTFCQDHQHNGAPEDHTAWLVMRDILHALLAPIVALYDHSTDVAQHSVRSYRQEDLEYAYSGKARNAYVWLQSFLSTEKDWCLSQGCPACIVLQALDGEAPLRLIIASCLLSSVKSSVDLGRPTLPSFDFFTRSIAQAMTDDRLWGISFYERTELKAYALQDAIQDLMYQCQSIEMNILTPPSSPESVDAPSPSRLRNEPASPGSGDGAGGSKTGMPVKRSALAKKQAKMLREEALWLKTAVGRQCGGGAGGLVTPDFASPITTEFVRRLSTV